jgi:tripartite-type tricarboxylate transporter receptor subunit TctC
MSFASSGAGTWIHLDTPEIGKRLAEIGLEPVGSSPEELAADQRSEIVKWAKVVKDSGAKVE